MVDLEPFLVRRLPEEQVVDPVDPLQLFDRPGMVVDPEIDCDVVRAAVAAVLADDEEGGRLPATPVAARSLGGGEADEEPLREGAPAEASKVAASASTVAVDTRMFPCAA